MKKNKILILVLTLLCLSLALPAQKNWVYFKGKVLDREKQTGLSGVNISIPGTKLGTSTGKRGEFSILLDTVPVYLNFSHLGYETQRIWFDNTSGSIMVLMNPAAGLLQEVEIRANNEPVPFFKDSRYALFDYEVDSALVYLLVYRFHLVNSELLCKTVSGDTLASSGPLRFRPVGLFRDCMGNLHLLGSDSAYQVCRRMNRLELVFPVGINRFRSVLPDCVASTENLLFFRKESPDHLKVDFYTINRQTSRKQPLTSVKEEEKLKMLGRNPDDYRFLLMDSPPGERDDIVSWQWVHKVLYKSNNTSLYKIGDRLCVFNTGDHTLELYTLKGVFTSKLRMPVMEVNEGRWTAEIYIDDAENKAYTSFMKNGQFTLYRIDLNTGELKRKVRAVHGFPKKIRVHNNFLFYVYDLPGEGDNKHLFRQKL